MKNKSVSRLAFQGLIAAVYAALTMCLGFMSYGGVQFRVSEVMCILPFFFPHTVWGLFIGCFIANLMSPVGIADIVFGSLASLLSCLCVAALGRGGRGWGRSIAACFMPVVFNAVIIGAVLAFTAAPAASFGAFFSLYALQVGAGEAAVMFILGLPLIRILPKKSFFARLAEKI